MSFPPFNNESWEEAPQQTLTWNNSDSCWEYDGDYGGCDLCIRYISVPDEATWADGYSPTSVSFTVEVLRSITEYAVVSFRISTTQEDFYFENDSSLFKGPGTYTLTLPLESGYEVSPGVFTAITSYNTGYLADIIAVGWHLGNLDYGIYGEESWYTVDRPFKITHLTFLPDLSELPIRWMEYVKTTETEI